MAVVKFGAIVTDMKGKLGGHVFQGSKGGATMRTKSTKQVGRELKMKSAGAHIPGIDMTWPSVLSRVASTWRNLTPSAKASWENLVGTWTFTNRFGDVVNRNGYSIFTACNMNRVLSGQNLLDEAPIPESSFPMDVVIELSGADSEVYLTVKNPEAVGQYLVLEQAPLVNKAKLNPSKKFKIIGHWKIADNSQVKITDMLNVPSSINIFTDDFAMFFRAWTFNENFNQKRGIEKVDIRRGF